MDKVGIKKTVNLYFKKYLKIHKNCMTKFVQQKNNGLLHSVSLPLYSVHWPPFHPQAAQVSRPYPTIPTHDNTPKRTPTMNCALSLAHCINFNSTQSKGYRSVCVLSTIFSWLPFVNHYSLLTLRKSSIYPHFIVHIQ